MRSCGIFNQRSYNKLIKQLNERQKNSSYLGTMFIIKNTIYKFFREQVDVNFTNPDEINISTLINESNLKNRILKSKMAKLKFVLKLKMIRHEQDTYFGLIGEELLFVCSNYSFDKTSNNKNIKMSNFLSRDYKLPIDFNFFNEKEFTRNLNSFLEKEKTNKYFCTGIRNNFDKIIFSNNSSSPSVRFKQKFNGNEEAFVDFLFEKFNLVQAGEVKQF